MALYDFDGIAKSIATSRGPVEFDQADQPSEGDTPYLKPNGKWGYTPVGSGGESGGDGSGLTNDMVIKTTSFTALVNHRYEVSAASLGEGDLAITLPAAPQDGDRVALVSINSGTRRFLINSNGHSIVYPTMVASAASPQSFAGWGFWILVEYRTAGAGGNNSWHTVDGSPNLFGSYYNRAYAVADTVEAGSHNAKPFEILPVDLSVGSVFVTLPPTPPDGTKVLVKIRAFGAGQTCLVQTPDNGDSIDWLYPFTQLDAEGDWVELLFSAVDGTWLVIG